MRRDDAWMLSYHERDHVVKFGVEFCGPEADGDFILYAGDALDTEDISPERKQEILHRVLSAVAFMGQKALVG